MMILDIHTIFSKHTSLSLGLTMSETDCHGNKLFQVTDALTQFRLLCVCLCSIRSDLKPGEASLIQGLLANVCSVSNMSGKC